MTGCPCTSTVAFPSRFVTLSNSGDEESEFDELALGQGSFLGGSPVVLVLAERARVVVGSQAAKRAMAWAGWWRQ
jgi:hypothetical protein